MAITTYRAVHLLGKGGLEQLKDVELPLSEPGPGELRIRVRASGAGFTDIIMRTGYYPYRPPFPFVPGYEVVGEVDAIGAGVTGFALGQRVCALTVHGGCAESLTREAVHFTPVPEGLDDAEVIALILNYVTAYQAVHRAAQLQPGQTALVTGANGGVGTALLEVLREAGVQTLAAAGSRHFELVRGLGATPIESRKRPLDELVHGLEQGKDGVDASFDSLGGRITGECVRATRKGGMVVSFGFTGTASGGGSDNLAVLRGFAALYLLAPLSGRRQNFYGITQIYRKDPQPFKEDLQRLFSLLQARRIQPRIAARLPLLACRQAQELLMAGGVSGKIVLLRDIH